MCVFDFYKENLGIEDPGLIDLLASKTQRKHLRKGELLVQEGTTPAEIYFLFKGIIRGFFIDANGRDTTDCIVFECGKPIVAAIDLASEARMSVEALTECDVLLISALVAENLMESYSELLAIYNHFLQESLEYHWQVKKVLHQCNAMQRYNWFLQAFPGLADSINSKYIASFLGMTPVTLSRLRRAIREEQPPCESRERYVR